MLEKLPHRFASVRPFAVPLGLAALIGVSVGACTVSVGEGDTGPYDFDAGTGSRSDSSTTPKPTPVDAGNLACNSCLFQGCSGQHAVCQGNAECLAIYQCATKAGCDQACVNSCFESHPSGQKEYTALYTCDQQQTCSTCASSCGVAQTCSNPEPVVDSGTPVDPDSGTQAPLTCSGCSAQRCANEQAACAPSTDCDAYSSCVLVCSDASCTDLCAEAHPPGKQASDALASCTTNQCKTECGF